MKKKIIVFLALLFVSSNILFAQNVENKNDLEIIRAFVVTDSDGDDEKDLKVLVYVKNTGEKSITVLTKNLQLDTFKYADRPKELHICLSSTMKIDGAPVILSRSYLAPVTINSGEVAEIEHYFRAKDDLDEVVIVYDMLNDWSKRFKTWHSRIRSEKIKVMKFKKQ